MSPSERLSATARLPYAAGLDSAPGLVGRAVCRAPAEPAALSLPSERVASIDLLRIVAAIGIIWFHTEGAPHTQIGYAGLPIFLLVYFSLIARRGSVQTPRQFLRRRWERLLKPWLFWSGVYGACRLVKAVCALDPTSLTRLLSLQTLLAGTCIHLWYLPYAFGCGLLLYLLNRRIRHMEDTLVVPAATLVGLLLLVACTLSLHAWTLPRPLPQWAFGWATVPLGLAVGRSLSVPSHWVRNFLLLLVSGTTLATCAILMSLRLDSLAVPYSLAIVLVCLAYGWQVDGNGWVATVAPLTLGIYLLHPLVILGVTHLFPAQGHYPAFIMIVACLSGAVTWGLMQTPLRKFV